MIDEKYYESAALAILVLNILSFLSLSFVITIYLLRWKLIASFPMRLSLYLCLSCLVQSLYVLMYPPMLVNQAQAAGQELTGFCIFESMVKTSSDLSSILWTSIIIYSSYASVVHGAMLERLQLFFLSIGYLLPLLLSLAPIFLNLYGYNIYFCWFDTNSAWIQFGLKVGYFFGPLWILFLLEIYWSARTYARLKQLGLEERELNIFKKLLLFPLILLASGLFSTIDLIYIYATNDFEEWLDIISLVLLSSYGLFTSLAYGFNPLIRDHIVILFCKGRAAVRESSTNTDSSRKTEKLAQLIAM